MQSDKLFSYVVVAPLACIHVSHPMQSDKMFSHVVVALGSVADGFADDVWQRLAVFWSSKVTKQTNERRRHPGPTSQGTPEIMSG